MIEEEKKENAAARLKN